MSVLLELLEDSAVDQRLEGEPPISLNLLHDLLVSWYRKDYAIWKKLLKAVCSIVRKAVGPLLPV